LAIHPPTHPPARPPPPPPTHPPTHPFSPQGNEAKARERQAHSELAAARSEVTKLKAQLGGAKAAESEVTRLRGQLASAQATADEARAATDAARRQAAMAEAEAGRLRSQLGAAQAAAGDATALREQLSEARAAAEEARLAVSRTAGEKDEERAVANRNLRVRRAWVWSGRCMRCGAGRLSASATFSTRILTPDVGGLY
jgi:hypothetical protein